MNIPNLLIYFITGGIVTTFIVALEGSGHRIWSGLAALVPVFTLVAYFFIGQMSGGEAVSQHAKWVLVGTLVSWVPYMLVVAYLASRIGPQKGILAGLATFFVFALLYLFVTHRFGLFR